MKERLRLNYISNRVIGLGIFVFLGMILLLLRNVFLYFHSQESGWNVVLSLLIVIAYTGVGWFYIIRPYKRSELLLQRFLEGYKTESGDFDSIFLSPYMEQAMDET